MGTARRVRFANRAIILVDAESVRCSGSWTANKHGGVRTGERIVLERMAAYLNGLDEPILVDIGANTGSFCLLTVLVPGLRVVAFEPNPEAFALLRQNLELNNLADRVDFHPFALGNRNGTASLRIPADPNWWGQATLADNPLRQPFDSGATSVEVEIKRLDDVIDGPVSFIKIDTEGNELDVMRGAKRILETYKPGVQFEIQRQNLAQFGLERGAPFDFLIGVGYTAFAKVGPEEWWAT